jgi:hypothetical protein
MFPCFLWSEFDLCWWTPHFSWLNPPLSTFFFATPTPQLVVAHPPASAAQCGGHPTTRQHAELSCTCHRLSGIPTPLKNMKVSWDDSSQYMEKWSKCSKPTRSTNMGVLTRLVEGKIYRKPLFLLQIQSFWQIFPKNSRFSLAFNMVFIRWFSYRKLRCGCQRESCIILHSLCWSFWVFFAVCDCKHYIPDTYVVKLPIFPETRYTTCSDTQTFNT